MSDPPFHQKVLITLGVTLPILLGILLLGVVFKVLLLVLAGALVAISIHALAGRIRKHLPMNETWSKLLAVLLVLGLSTGFGLLVVPRVAEQVAQMRSEFPTTMEQARTQLGSTKVGSMILDQLPEDPTNFISQNAGLVKKSFGVLSATFGILGDVYVILLLALFFVLSPGPYSKGIISLVPRQGRLRASEVLNKVHGALERWIKGKILSMILVAILTALGLWAMGIPMALSLSLVAGVLCFIPNFGPLLSMVPAVLIALTQGPQMALYVVLLYMGIQFVESNFITPKIQKKMVDLPLAMIMIAQVTLGMLTGTLGLILATPIIVIIMELIKLLYVEDVLGGGVEELT